MTTLEGIDEATLEEVRGLVVPHIRRTPLIAGPRGGTLKLESLQPTGSFKVRGFFGAALALGPDQRSRGLLTVSAGNSALACAHVARELGVPCRVVMVDTAPALKLEGVRALGAEVVLMPQARLFQWMAEQGWEGDREVFIHPHTDRSVIEGHATIVPEIIAQCPEVQRVLVPVGGGGLILGVAWGFAALKPDVRVVGVQSDAYPLWPRAFAAGGAVTLTSHTIADGTAAPFNPLTFDRLRASVSEWIVVREAAVRDAVAQLATEAKVVAEGAGALAFAAMTEERPSKQTVALVSGGNIDASRLAELLRP